MSSWSEGYVADIPYALGFYRETVPTHIAFAAASLGRDPGVALAPARVLELGFGMGLGFVVNAAANPATHFEGVDFNPQHVAHASELASEAKLTNLTIREASFQDLAREAQEGQHDLDLIVLHGILTWVSEDAHTAIVEIARKRLKPSGLLYVSYNCMPGWAPVLPLQRLMRENAKRVGGRSDAQTAAGLELVNAMLAENAAYFVNNPALKPRIERLAKLDPSYLAHEYLNANWHIFHFADVAEMFAPAKLGFVGSASLVENMDNLAVPEAVRPRVAAEKDPIFRETLRDIASNKQFRRDLFGRGTRALNGLEFSALLARLTFALAVPRSAFSLKLPSPVGELEANPPIYNAIADLLATKNATFAEIASLSVFDPTNAGAALQAVTLLVNSGQVLPGQPQELAAKADARPAQRLNKVIAERMLRGRGYSFLAAPAVGSGVQLSQTDLLILASYLALGAKPATDALVSAVEANVQRLNITWQRNDAPLTDPAERRAAIAEEVARVLGERVPVWKRLGAI